MIVVLTKLDEATAGFHSGGCSVDVTDVAERVSKHIQEVCGLKEFPEDIVIPVYGQWADCARCLANDPECYSLRQEAERILIKYMSQPAGQGEHPGYFLQKKPTKWVVKELEKLSNICVLETR